jgi:MFS family permease
VLGFGCTLAMIVYMDRACMASAASPMIEELGLTSAADFWPVFAAFALAYALFEVPNGWLADIFGPRKALIRISIWWSIFIALSGVVGMSLGGRVLGGVGTLVVVQFLAGVGEAGAFPNITQALHNWFPYHERGFAQGAVWTCGRLMGGLTPLVWTILVAGIATTTVDAAGHAAVRTILPPLLHWRAVFWAFGLLGVIWCVLFSIFFRDRPEQHRRVNAAELALIRSGGAAASTARVAVPWSRILLSRDLWLLCLMYGVQSYGWYFYITYYPKFLEQNLHVPIGSLGGALCKGGPLWMGAAGCLLGGFLTDRIIRRTGNRRWGRRIPGVIGHAMTALCFFACFLMSSRVRSPVWFIALVSLAGFSTDLAMGAGWASCQDIGKRYSAIVAACMNTIGNFCGSLAPWVFAFFLQRSLNAHALALNCAVKSLTGAEQAAGLWNGYRANFLIAAGMYVVGVVCWLRIDATRPICAEPATEELPPPQSA